MNIVDAVWQSGIIFFVAYFSYLQETDFDKLSFGFSLIFAMIITSLIHVLIQTSRIDWSVLAATAFSFLVFIGFTLIFDVTCIACIPGESPYQVSYIILRQARFWLTNLLTIVTAMLPRYTIKCFNQRLVNPFR